MTRCATTSRESMEQGQSTISIEGPETHLGIMGTTMMKMISATTVEPLATPTKTSAVTMELIGIRA